MSFIGTAADAVETFVMGLADSPWVLPALLAVCIIDAFFPPIPSESVVVAAAAIVVSGEGPPVWSILLVAIAGAWLGDNATYLIGRRIGTDRWAWLRRPRAARAVDVARTSFARRGVLFLMTARFIPVGRIAVNLTAGATGYPHRSFLRISAAAAVVWAVYSVGIGTLFGHVLADRPLLAAAVGIAVAVTIGVVADRVISRMSARRGPAPTPAPATTTSPG